MMKCPFVYSNEKRCSGYVSELKIIKAKVVVSLTEENKVRGLYFDTPYHVHLYCSGKENHAGYMRQDSGQMKVWYSDLPEEIRRQIERRDLGGETNR